MVCWVVALLPLLVITLCGFRAYKPYFDASAHSVLELDSTQEDHVILFMPVRQLSLPEILEEAGAPFYSWLDRCASFFYLATNHRHKIAVR